MALTLKQERFCQEFIATSNASEAYRRAYNAENMKPETIAKRANELMGNGDVAGRLITLRERMVKKLEITVGDLVKELEEARAVALTAETPQASAAISATMGKAKLLGLDKQLIELTGKDGDPIQHNVAHDLPGLTEALQAIAAKRAK